MKQWNKIGAVVIAVAVMAVWAWAGNPPTGTAGSVQCPVTGKPVDFTAHISTDSGPVYFCCGDCAPKYQAEPKKFDDKLAAQREALKNLPKVQVTCPVSGKPIDREVSAEHDGQTVWFCCSNCPPKYQADPAKYAGALAAGYTYQTRCPVTDKPIAANASAKLAGGETVFFCCDKCPPRFFDDPSTYVPNLSKQGYNIDVAEAIPADGR